MRLLIVDDSNRMRGLLRGLLRDLPTACWEAENGREAVELYAQHHPDVVLMDIRMPVMDGLEATRRIVAADPNAKIVMVTDYDDPAYRAMAAMVGAWDFIRKDRLHCLYGKLRKLRMSDG